MMDVPPKMTEELEWMENRPRAFVLDDSKSGMSLASNQDLIDHLRKKVESGDIEGRVFSTPRHTSGPWLTPGDYLVIRA